MPARGTKRKSTKTRRSQAKMVRLGLAPKLTPRETRQLQARAREDMRSIGNYVAVLVIEDLQRPNGSKQRRASPPGGRRVSYSIRIPLRPAQERQLKARAQGEMRSVPSYVAKLIVADLGIG